SAAIQPATAVREFVKSDQFDVVYVVVFSAHLAMTAFGAKRTSDETRASASAIGGRRKKAD
ncbi:hypothetical protein, partial [Bradyrhizobium sp.]|uniref:hypothetical protein n=1 Tax=Bradyrhizobium sp. TaxID=376 RepID=UPI003C78534F